MLTMQSDHLNLKQIAESGQCFRMNRIEENKYSLIAYGKYVELSQVSKNKILIDPSSAVDSSSGENFPSEEDFSIWEKYFDIEYDYGSVVKKLMEGKDDFIRNAVIYGSGLRILRQEPFEILISFIISQNKNIPAIKSAVEKLCQHYGEEKRCLNRPGETYFDFPKPEALAAAGKDALRALGIGYRDEYVHSAAVAVSEGRLDLSQLQNKDSDSLMNELMSLKGVGKKVASCVALFGFHRFEIYPVDVWINRVNKEIYKNKFSWQTYGDIAGLVQQYMFYYIRNCERT
ncbi:MAG TPA: DNA glycosylase [Anaerovoracaceae bacterium]|nr:DNA glycosylase [Anaerovoracaceae bacterium]